MLTYVTGLAGALLLAAAPLAAQVDYRNLDDDRPTVVEDAYPLERYAFELILPYHFERQRGGGTVQLFVPELEYGIVRNGELGIKAPVAIVRDAGATESGLAGLGIFALYNLNTESPSLPALALRANANLPIGGLAGSGVALSLKAIATRSFGSSRVHLNGAYTIGAEDAPGAAEGPDRWWAGAAVDRTLFRHSLLLIGEVYARQSRPGAFTEVNAAVGLRFQWTPTAVLDLGASRGLRSGDGPDIGVTLGVSWVFGVAALMPRGGVR